MIRVLFICHGNICRSTMAESVFTYMVKERGLEKKFFIDSAATSTEEIGNRPHYGTVAKLREVGQMTRRDYDEFDYIIGMDSANIRNMGRISGGDPYGKFYRMLEFAGSLRDVADPWYTDDFDATYRDITEGLEGFFKFLKDRGEI